MSSSFSPPYILPSTPPPAAEYLDSSIQPLVQQQQPAAATAALQFTFSSPEQGRHPSSVVSSPPGSLIQEPQVLGQFHLSDEDTLVSGSDDDRAADPDDVDSSHHRSRGSGLPRAEGIDLTTRHTIAASDILTIPPSSVSDVSPATTAASQPLERAGDSDEEESNNAFQRLMGSPRPGGAPRTFLSSSASSPIQPTDSTAFSPNDSLDFALSPSSPPGSFPAQPGDQELWSLSSSPRSTPSSSVNTSLGRFNPFRFNEDGTKHSSSTSSSSSSSSHSHPHTSNANDTSLQFDDSDSAEDNHGAGQHSQQQNGGPDNETVLFFRSFSQQLSHPPGVSTGPQLNINDEGIHSPSSYRDAADEEFMINSDNESVRPSPLRSRRSILSVGPRVERRKKSVRWLDSETNQKLTQVYLLDYEYDRKPTAFSLPSRVPMPNPNLPDPISSAPTKIPMIIVAVCILAIIAVVLILLLRHFGVI